jgi:glycosyltransferase involved in cell wall biosynthesis
MAPEVHADSATPTVTIVMAAFRATFLDEAVRSVLEQDYPELELVALDDSGGADVMPILERHASRDPERVRIVKHPTVGQARTLNRGFELARGELLGHLGDDDVLLPGAVAKLAGALASAPEAVVAHGAYQVMDETGEVTGTARTGEWSLVEALRLHHSPVGPGALVRRPVLERMGGWDPDLRYRSDFDFWIRVASAGPFAFVSDPVARWRAHPGALSAEPATAIAAEHVSLVEKVFAGDDLPDEISAVRAEAFRSAYIQAGVVCSPSVPVPAGARYAIADRLAPGAWGWGPADLQGDARLAALEAELERRDEVIARMRRRVEKLSSRRSNAIPPWWRRVARRARSWVVRSTP